MTTLRESFQFHLEHSGYVMPPGRAICAINVARAEMRAEDDPKIRFRWVDDPEGLDPEHWDHDLLKRTIADLENGILVCRGLIMERQIKTCPGQCECNRWEIVDSLWSIFLDCRTWESSNRDMRVYEAEMAYANLPST